MLKVRKAQSILEYVIIFSAVALAVVFFLTQRPQFTDALKNILNKAGDKVDREVDNFSSE